MTNDQEKITQSEEKGENQQTDHAKDQEGEKDDAQAIEEWLGSITENSVLTIRRLTPSWCTGWLEEIPIDGKNFPSITEIRNRWGGHKLSLRLRDAQGKLGKAHYLELNSFPPRVGGRPLRNPDQFPWSDEYDTPKKETPFYPQPPQQNKSDESMKLIAAMLEQQGRFQSAMMQALLSQQGSPKSPVKDMREMFGLMQMWRQLDPAQPQTGEGDQLGTLVNLASQIFGKAKSDKPKLKAPNPQAPTQQNPNVDFQQLLGQLSPNEIGQAAAAMFEGMDDKQRRVAMGEFLEYSGMDGPEQTDDYEDDDDDDDEQ